MLAQPPGRPGAEPHRALAHLLPQPPAAVPPGAHGGVDHLAAGRDCLHQALGHGAPSRHQHEGDGRDRVGQGGHDAAGVARGESPGVAHHHHPAVDQEGRGREGVDHGPGVEIVDRRPAVLLDHQGRVPIADEAVDERARLLGDERGVVPAHEVGGRCGVVCRRVGFGAHGAHHAPATAASASRTRAGAGHVVDPKHPAAQGDPEGGRRQGGGAAPVDVEVEQDAEEGLVRGRQQQWEAEAGQGRRSAQQEQRLPGGLAEVEAGVDHDPLGRDAGGEGAPGPLGQEPSHLGHHVVVARVGVGHPGGQADVGGHHRRLGPSRRGEVVGIGEAADVVAHHRARLVGGGGHAGAPRVDRDRHVEPPRHRLDGRDDPVELLGLGHLRPGTGLDPAHVEDVGPLGHQLLGPRQSASRP